MRPYIPSLQSLLAFEAASRHLSFTRAAQELELTQTAISHQIKTLEDRLEVKLFVRRRNVLTLTPAAREYLNSVHEAINLLSIATAHARKKKPSTVLTVTCLPTYAVKCLIPALPEFQGAHPDITVHVATSSTFNEFERNSYDVAIRYGSGRWASTRADRLHGEEFFPVCSPAVLAEAGKFGSIADCLSRMRQIRTYFYSMYQDDWPAWLEAAVHGGVEFASESVFHLQLTSLAAAVDGVGIAIGRTPLVNGDLASGRLVAPFDVRVPSSSAYFVTSPIDKARTKKVELFREWALARLGEKRGHNGHNEQDEHAGRSATHASAAVVAADSPC
ncbi:LysR substrate-binding domain-containing protein [Paraburkholderia sp. SARCC-3016]|uniref:LysR substrate-binding domain-containing protein n=1 Tax=Paraburkholderia sp. SARCC-3016 TaxID=3058611 RepID=UPI002809227E|nr:LysR substrate-binding domain-containing protein [Paraburkholderia sp. SARCC-3016]MDQ7980541.1 LysR substrate-binding domain-containing protein [Paraburkholderia sp. SARCC-3016]